MPAVAIWGGRLVAWWLAGEVAKSVATTATATSEGAANLTKLAPWVVGGLAVYLVWSARRG